MPLIDITNPDIIKFLVETYDRTARLRMKWNTLHGDKLAKAATLHREEKGYFEIDVLKEAMAAGMPTISRDYKSGGLNRLTIPKKPHIPGIAELKKGHSIVDVGLGDPKKDPRLARPDTDLSKDPIMRPVDSKQKKIIYKGIPYFGREVYLKSRYKMAPEDKYYFPDCSSWDYGWRLCENFFGVKAPEYGLVWRLHHDLKGRSGPHPDPAHYNAVLLAGPNRCNM